jgi:hypothetical protein
MAPEFRLFIEPKHLANVIFDLNQLEGIQLQLPHQELSLPEPQEHGFYSASFAELVSIIISITSALTTFTSLAITIYKLKEQRNVIVINQHTAYLSEFASPEELATYFEEMLGSVQRAKTEHMKDMDVISILFLAAEPTDAARLRLGEELREIQEKLQLAKYRERFVLYQRMSVRPTDISQALLDVQPRIVHFSGHGTSTGALCFENQIGHIHPIQPNALAALFEQFANQVDCVLLNACYTETQAQAIAQHINCVIGMSQVISDRAAVAFAIGFYQALGAGRTIEAAYKLGCVQLRLQGIPEHLIPLLMKKEQV